jgi:Fis family transcriptional regulator
MTDKPKVKNKKSKKKQDMSLGECARLSLQKYFEDLGQEVPSSLYAMVIAEVEGPMLEVVMKHAKNNQSQASEILGLNRGTLRKKLKEYDLI